MGFPKNVRTIEIMQQCAYGWTTEGVQRFLKDWSVIHDYAYILHDKDTQEDGSPVAPHIHLMLRFNDSTPVSSILARAKAVFQNDTTIAINNLQKCTSWKGCIAYLTHSNAPEKHLYDDLEVISNYEWQADRDKAMQGKNKLSLLLKQIETGEVREYNIYEYCTIEEYTKFSRALKQAFEYRAKMLMNKGDRDMQAIFINGESGAGKTSYAKEFCRNKNLSFFVSSGSNDVLDGYGGQDVIILDDLRPSCLNLSDLLKMLDNNTSSSVKSRYRNKVLECKYIIITTTLDIETFFRNVFSEEPETATQLRRRCQTVIKMTKKELRMGIYIQETDEYMFTPAIPNPIALKYGLSKKDSIAIMSESLKSMFSDLQGLDEALDKMQADVEEEDRQWKEAQRKREEARQKRIQEETDFDRRYLASEFVQGVFRDTIAPPSEERK